VSDNPPETPNGRLAQALDTLVERGTITAEQRGAILAEVATGPGGGGTAGGADSPPPSAPAPAGTLARPRAHRTLTEVLVEVGLYVGSALVLAAAVVLVAQNWDELGEGTQIGILAATAVVTGAVGWILSQGSQAGSARRRLAGVVLTATAASAAGTVALVLDGREWTAVAALAAATAIMLGARMLAASAVTEIGLFAAAFALLQVTGEWLRPERAPADRLLPGDPGDELDYETPLFDRLMPVASIAFGVLWALLVARRMMHRELAVALGMLVAFFSAMPLIADEALRSWGLPAMAALAAVGFWRFMVEGFWPWLAGAIASVTAFVFWAVGGADRPAVAILVAGLVLLASSGLGMRAARRRHRASDQRREAESAAP
jgi:hypothetical protein